MKEGERVRILGLHPSDAFYPDRKNWIGKEGVVTKWRGLTKRPYVGCRIILDSALREKDGSAHATCFYAVLLRRVKGGDPA